MSANESERISAAAKKICESEAPEVHVTDLLPLHKGYVLVLDVPKSSFNQERLSKLGRALATIPGVNHVCVDIPAKR